MTFRDDVVSYANVPPDHPFVAWDSSTGSSANCELAARVAFNVLLLEFLHVLADINIARTYFMLARSCNGIVLRKISMSHHMNWCPYLDYSTISGNPDCDAKQHTPWTHLLYLPTRVRQTK